MADLLHPDETGEDEVSEAPRELGEFEVAATAPDALEADLLSRACEDAGIPAIVRSPRSGLVGKLASPVEVFNILVPAREVDRARALIAERREALEADPEGAGRAAEEAEAAEESSGEADRG